MKKIGILIGLLFLSFATIVPQRRWTTLEIQKNPKIFQQELHKITNAQDKGKLLSYYLNDALKLFNIHDTSVPKLLIKLGAQVDRQIIDRFIQRIATASSKPKESDVEKVIEILLRDFPINDQDARGRTLLLLSAGYNAVPITKKLIQLGADVNLPDNFGNTPLLYAARNNLEVVKMLLQKDANPNIKDINGLTPLIVAAIRDNAEIIRELVEAGAHINAIDNDGYTALDRALNLGKKAALQELQELEKEQFIEEEGLLFFDN